MREGQEVKSSINRFAGFIYSGSAREKKKKTRQSALPSVTKAKLRLHKSSFTAHARDVCASDNMRKTLVFLLS